jgi:hypothetical protein
MSKGFKAGDIVEIPLPSGKVAIGWIVYVSNYFKSIIGLIGYGFKGMDLNRIGVVLPATPPIYTAIEAAKHYQWAAVGRKPVDEAALLTTERIVGGEVFVGDQCVRSATDEDRERLHKMLVKGMPLVHEELEEIGAKQDSNGSACE